jgi:predicted RNA-binding Zn-ribbon protein involved in translation (DUF1610 family)
MNQPVPWQVFALVDVLFLLLPVWWVAQSRRIRRWEQSVRDGTWDRRGRLKPQPRPAPEILIRIAVWVAILGFDVVLLGYCFLIFCLLKPWVVFLWSLLLRLDHKPLPAATRLILTCACCGRGINRLERLNLAIAPQCPNCGSQARRWERVPSGWIAYFISLWRIYRWKRAQRRAQP